MISFNCCDGKYIFILENNTIKHINVYVKYNDYEVEHIFMGSHRVVESSRYHIKDKGNIIIVIIAYRKDNGELAYIQKNFEFAN